MLQFQLRINWFPGLSIAPDISVELINSAGQVDTTSDAVVSLAIGNNPSSGNLLGTLSAAAVNGVATFSGLSIDTPGLGYTLLAYSASLVTAVSSSFNISVSTPTQLVFTTEPANAASGASLGSITVSLEDSLGHVVTGSTAAVTLVIANNAGPGGVLSGTTENAVNGVATFPALSINTVGTGYTLSASSGSLSSVTSTTFNIGANTASKIVFTTQPANAVSGASLGSITVKVEDSAGNVVTGSSASVTLVIGNNAGPGGVLSGTLTVSAVNGVATFPGLSINVDGTV